MKKVRRLGKIFLLVHPLRSPSIPPVQQLTPWCRAPNDKVMNWPCLNSRSDKIEFVSVEGQGKGEKNKEWGDETDCWSKKQLFPVLKRMKEERKKIHELRMRHKGNYHYRIWIQCFISFRFVSLVTIRTGRWNACDVCFFKYFGQGCLLFYNYGNKKCGLIHFTQLFVCNWMYSL